MNFIKDEGGTTAIEYALLASMVTMMLAGALGPLRDGLVDIWSLSVAVDGALN